MGAGQSTPPVSPSPSTPTPSSTSSSSSTSPFSLSPLTPSKLCEFSKQKTDEFIKEIEFLKDSEFKMLKETKVPEIPANVAAKLFQLPSFSFETKQSHLDDPDINRYPLLIKRILCLEVVDILKIYIKTLQEIIELCKKCRGQEALEDIDSQIDEIMREFEKGLEWFNLFIPNFQKGNFGYEEYGTMLKDKLVQITGDMYKMFENIEIIKIEMKAICMKRQNLQEERSVAFTAKGLGGTRSTSKSRYRSIKRKQKKMKSRSKHFSKTRNHKKIQQQ
jgi:hypothetical protein